MKKIFYISILLFTLFSCGDKENFNGPEDELYPHKYVFDRIEYTPEKVSYVLQDDGFAQIGDWKYEISYDTAFDGSSFAFYEKSELAWFSLAFVDESKVDLLIDDTVVKDSVRSHYLIDDKFVHVLDEEVPTEIDTFYTLKFDDDKTELSSTTILLEYTPNNSNEGFGWGDFLFDDSVKSYLDNDQVLDTIPIGDTVSVWTFESVMKRTQ